MFSDALALVLKWEGGYINDPNDPGGETNLGICKRDHPNLDIKNLTVAQVTPIYKTNYWDACKCDLFPSVLATCVFDSAVNQGTGTAVRLLQTSLRLTADGVIGNKTISVAQNTSVKISIRNFTVTRILKYVNTKNFGLYGSNWIKRTLDVMMNSL